MTEFDRKVLENFPGKVVRKDLTSLMKKGANVPTYVLEYLLGMYCATDDEEAIEVGLVKIKKILSENYVRPDESEKIRFVLSALYASRTWKGLLELRIFSRINSWS